MNNPFSSAGDVTFLGLAIAFFVAVVVHFLTRGD